jgi:predicted AlkP superfamily phosphohydrolase/phosphomutase
VTSSVNVAILGLDGVPFTLLSRLVQTGVMPCLAEIAESGAFLQMDSTLPAISSVAWTSFMTGEAPGRHGIFGFTDLKRGELALHLPSFDDIQCPPIWHRLPDKLSIVVNLPFTFPARELNGILIAGFVAPIFDRSVYPESLLSWLKSLQYRIDVDAVKGRMDRKALVQDLFDTLNLREKVILTLVDTRPWDLFIGVITGTDRLHHFFFDAFGDVSHPFHEDFMAYYRRLDAFVGRFVERIGRRTKLIVLSDHGFTTLHSQIYLSHILHTMGYLSFARPNPQSLNDIAFSSLAFAMDPSRIYLNSRDRFRNGLLSHREAMTVRERLRSELASLRLIDIGVGNRQGASDPEAKLFARVLLREEVYEGDMLEWAPDLIVVPSAGYDPKATIQAPGPFMKDIFTGMHTHDDAFLIVSGLSGGDRLTRPHIKDVATLVCEAFGQG